VLGEIDDHMAIFGAEHRMRKVDGEIEQEAVVRFEPRNLIAVDDFDCRFDPQITLRGVLFGNAGRLQQEDEWARASIQNRQFGTGDVDVQVVDPQTRQRRHQVLHRRYLCAILFQRRGQPRVTDVARVGGNGCRIR
jgi:hypothetical protein